MLIANNSSAARLEIIHHVVGIVGSALTLFAGKYVISMASFTLITEVSTVFNNIRKLLLTHGMKDSKLFIANGIVFTFTFLVFRGMFFVWMLSTRFFPAVVRDNYAQDDPFFLRICIFTATIFYGILCALNFYWLFLIIKGFVAVFKPRAKDTVAEQEFQKFED